MAKYQSIVKIKGTIDDYVFYDLNGISVMRKKSGFNGEDFKSKESYRKVRENSSEFGHCSKSGKMLREALQPFIQESGDKYLYQSFAKLMTKIKDLDTESQRGKRRIQHGLKNPLSTELLRNFQFGEMNRASSFLTKSFNLWDFSIEATGKINADEIILIILEPDFENLTTERQQSSMPVLAGQKTFIFENSNNETDQLLYFAVLRKNEKVMAMGFI